MMNGQNGKDRKGEKRSEQKPAKKNDLKGRETLPPETYHEVSKGIGGQMITSKGVSDSGWAVFDIECGITGEMLQRDVELPCDEDMVVVVRGNQMVLSDNPRAAMTREEYRELMRKHGKLDHEALGVRVEPVKPRDIEITVTDPKQDQDGDGKDG